MLKRSININIYHYTYLITNLSPTTTERFYIGVRKAKTYPTSDTYMGSSEYLNKAIQDQGIVHFKKEIIEIWISSALANAHEEWIHGYLNVADNPDYYNKRNANAGFYTNKYSTAKQVHTIHSAEWKETIGKKQRMRQVNTVNTDEWINTKGKEKSEKIKKTVSASEWKETVGKIRINKQLTIFRNSEWKETVGLEKKQKEMRTKSDPEWQHTIGASLKIKMSENHLSEEYKLRIGNAAIARQKETKKSTNYKIKNSRTCEYCHKTMDKGNYNRWHGKNCRNMNIK